MLSYTSVNCKSERNIGQSDSPVVWFELTELFYFWSLLFILACRKRGILHKEMEEMERTTAAVWRKKQQTDVQLKEQIMQFTAFLWIMDVLLENISLVNSYVCVLLILVWWSIDHNRQYDSKLVGRGNSSGGNYSHIFLWIPTEQSYWLSQATELKPAEGRMWNLIPLHLWFLHQLLRLEGHR